MPEEMTTKDAAAAAAVDDAAAVAAAAAVVVAHDGGNQTHCECTWCHLMGPGVVPLPVVKAAGMARLSFLPQYFPLIAARSQFL